MTPAEIRREVANREYQTAISSQRADMSAQIDELKSSGTTSSAAFNAAWNGSFADMIKGLKNRMKGVAAGRVDDTVSTAGGPSTEPVNHTATASGTGSATPCSNENRDSISHLQYNANATSLKPPQALTEQLVDASNHHSMVGNDITNNMIFQAAMRNSSQGSSSQSQASEVEHSTSAATNSASSKNSVQVSPGTPAAAPIPRSRRSILSPWNCAVCTFLNEKRLYMTANCEACENPRTTTNATGVPTTLS